MRKRHFAAIIGLAFLLSFVVITRTEEKRSADYETVKKTIELSIGWAIDKDFNKLFSIWADDMFNFWLTSDSQIVGLDTFKKHAEQWKDPDFKATHFEFKDVRIKFSRSGDVAWYSCYLDDCGSYKGKEFCLKDVFKTGVLEKRNGKWVHVLSHASYPIDKIPEDYVRKYYPHLFEGQTPTFVPPETQSQ